MVWPQDASHQNNIKDGWADSFSRLIDRKVGLPSFHNWSTPCKKKQWYFLPSPLLFESKKQTPGGGIWHIKYHGQFIKFCINLLWCCATVCSLDGNSLNKSHLNVCSNIQSLSYLIHSVSFRRFQSTLRYVIAFWQNAASQRKACSVFIRPIFISLSPFLSVWSSIIPLFCSPSRALFSGVWCFWECC